jgi:pimeloyl-ACP methyl ester carboxylesterase
MAAESATQNWTRGREHWTNKGEVRLFLWEKPRAQGTTHRGTILFVHGSSMASQPTFDLHVPGRPDSSAMEYFASLGFDCWCMDNEGYGRSAKKRPINNDISNGADDLLAGADYIEKASGASKLLVYGISSGALKAALFAQRHPERVARLALDAFVWTGEGSPTLAERRKKLPQFARSCTAFSSATIRTPPTRPLSTPSPTPSLRSTTPCPPGRTSTCARSCRWSIRRRSPSRR